MNKRNIFIIFIVIILIAGIAAFIYIHPSFKQSLSTTATTSTQVNEQAARPVSAPLETEKVGEKYYSLDLTYPSNSSSTRSEIGTFVERMRSEFLESVPKTDDEAEYEHLDADRAYALNIKTTSYTSSSTITYKLETYIFTGGAHGGTFITTFTYDPEGKLITLEKLLATPEALNKLSLAARKYFYTKLDGQVTKEEIDTGTEAKEENFGTWYLTDEGITFVFQQYQIGPYVLGLQEFPMSRKDAAGILSI